MSEARRNDFWRILPGILVSLIALTIVLYIVDWQEVLSAWRQADYRYIWIFLPIYLISYIARSMAWRTLLKEEEPLRRVFLIMNAGYLLNNTLPFRLGELGRAFLLGRKGLGFWRVLSTILIERALDIILAAGLFLGAVLMLGSSQTDQMPLLIGSLVLLCLLALYVLARKQDWVLKQFNRLGQRWPRLMVLGEEWLRSFLDGLSALVDYRRFLRLLGWMVFSWVLAVYVQFLLIRAFIPDAQLLWAAFSVGVSSLGVALPSSPAHVGVYEAAVVGALSLLGVSPSIALAYALTHHVLYILFTGVFGVYALVSDGEALGSIYRNLRKRRDQA
jgi:uncharacterized protein (TIRG00374 family)